MTVKTFLKSLVVGWAACLFVLGSSLAQRPGGSGFGNVEARMAAETDSIMAVLMPAPEQTEAIKAILSARTEQLMALRPQPGAGRGGFQEIRQRRAEIEDQTLVALTALLSEPQLEAYKAYMQRRSEQQRRRGQRRGQ